MAYTDHDVRLLRQLETYKLGRGVIRLRGVNEYLLDKGWMGPVVVAPHTVKPKQKRKPRLKQQRYARVKVQFDIRPQRDIPEAIWDRAIQETFPPHDVKVMSEDEILAKLRELYDQLGYDPDRPSIPVIKHFTMML